MSGKTPHEKRCTSCSEKNIILIGLTGNGKSSVLRSILTYGNDLTQAAKVKIGNGNVSETQRCTNYRVVIPIKEHHLRDASNEIVIPQDPDRDDLSGYETVTKSHVHLNIIDTPGLDDSGSMEKKKSEIKDREESENAGANPADERHKLRILSALQQAKAIHGVAFVIKKHQTRAGSAQAHIHDLLKLFDSSLGHSKINYHIIHTQIDPEDRFNGLIATRTDAFRKDFNKRQVSHHFVDNKPDEDDEVAKYFARKSWSEMCKTFSTASEMHVQELRYLKSAPHRANDQELLRGFNACTLPIQQEIALIKAELAKKKLALIPIESQLQTRNSKLSNIAEQLAFLDTSEEQEIITYTGDAKRGFLSRVHTHFSHNSTHPIRRVYKEKDATGNWENESTSLYSWTVNLTADWLEEAKGKVTLYTQKRDIHEFTIRKLKGEKSDVEDMVKETNDSVSDMKQGISSLESKIKKLTSDFTPLRDQSLKLGTCKGNSDTAQFFLLRDFRDSLKYFTVDNPYAVSLGYQYKSCTIPKKFLPYYDLKPTKTRSAISAKLSELKGNLAAKGRAIEALEAHNIRKRAAEHEFAAMLAPCAESQELLKAARNNIKFTVFDEKFKSPPQLSSKEEAFFVQSREKMEAQGQKVAKLLHSLLVERGRKLKFQQDTIASALSELRAVLDETNLQLKTWRREKGELELAREALEHVSGLVNKDEVDIGAFTVLMQAIESEHKEPYMRLYEAVFEAFKVREMEL